MKKQLNLDTEELLYKIITFKTANLQGTFNKAPVTFLNTKKCQRIKIDLDEFLKFSPTKKDILEALKLNYSFQDRFLKDIMDKIANYIMTDIKYDKEDINNELQARQYVNEEKEFHKKKHRLFKAANEKLNKINLTQDERRALKELL